MKVGVIDYEKIADIIIQLSEKFIDYISKDE